MDGYRTTRLTYGSKLGISFNSELAFSVIMNAHEFRYGRSQHWLDRSLGRFVGVQRFTLFVSPCILSPLIPWTNDRGIDVPDPPFLFAMD